MTFADVNDPEKDGFSKVKYRGPKLSIGLQADDMDIRDGYTKQDRKHNDKNVALKKSEFLTEVNTRKQNVTNYVGGEIDYKDKYKMVKLLFGISNYPETEKKLHAVLCC